MGIKEANCYIWTEHLLSLTGEHCEIAQSQAPQQPKQLGTIKHTETIVLEHVTLKYWIKWLVIKNFYLTIKY